MATHSSILAWKIPGTEEPGGAVYGFAQGWTRLSDLAAAVAFHNQFFEINSISKLKQPNSKETADINNNKT